MAVAAGYGLMVAVTMAGMGAVWAILGGELSFRTGSTEASLPWSVAGCILGLVASVAGGFVAAALGRRRTPVTERLLATLVLGLGLVLAVAQLGAEPEALPAETAPADLTFFEAGEIARSPTWYNFVIPWIGVGGVLLGGRRRRLGSWLGPAVGAS